MPPKLFKKFLFSVFCAFTLFSAFFIGYVRHLERHNIFYPTKEIAQTPRDIPLAFEDIFLKTKDGVAINGWLVPHSPNKSVLIFLHGNGGNISTRLEKIQMFHAMGVNVFIIDYRGYGKSEGQPSEKGVYLDAQAAYDFLKSRKEFTDQKLIVYGESLGGAVAVDLAVNRLVDGIIVDSSFTSAQDMARVIYPFIPSFLINVKLESLSKIQNLRMPKLFIHSPEDDIVPFHLGRKLFDAAEEPKVFLEIQGTHNQGFRSSREKYLQGIENFLMQFNTVERKK